MSVAAVHPVQQRHPHAGAVAQSGRANVMLRAGVSVLLFALTSSVVLAQWAAGAWALSYLLLIN